jgi:PhzF family phenazine biosynthesis protein
MMVDVELLSVFTYGSSGGNPCPIVTDARGMNAADMQDVARRYGHEAGFVLPAEHPDEDFVFRFFVPNHEMEMCGHATIGALWALARKGQLRETTVRISTRSGPVTGYVSAAADPDPKIEITQPVGRVTPLAREQEDCVLAALAIGRDALADLPMHNAVTSRVKTLVPMRDPERLNALSVNASSVEAACRRINSTGLYPWAVLDKEARLFEARQFPRSSGYPEDAATGIAAAALAFGLLHEKVTAADDRVVRILQGRAMGRLSEISVTIGFAQGRAAGCLLGGAVARIDSAREDHHSGSFANCRTINAY